MSGPPLAEEAAISWLKSHGDSVEQAFADEVCRLIPKYALLWARFIGNTGEATRHPLVERAEKMMPQKRAAIDAAFDGLSASHYTIFNHVRSCQNKIRAAAQAEEAKPHTGLTHSAFMEAMEEFYFHYGVVSTQWERVWAVLLDIDPNDSRLRQKIQDAIKGVFGGGAPATIIHRHVVEILDACRNSIEHYPRTAILRDEDTSRLLVRSPRKKGEPWKETIQRRGVDVLAVEMMKRDFELLQFLLNATYPKLIESIESFLAKHNLQSMAQEAFDSKMQNRMETGMPSLSASVGASDTSSSSSVSYRMIGSAISTVLKPPIPPQQ